jgi:hypothetical protein
MALNETAIENIRTIMEKCLFFMNEGYVSILLTGTDVAVKVFKPHKILLRVEYSAQMSR